MIGFGAALTGSSAWLIYNHEKRNEIMNDLFERLENGGAGINFLRIPVSLLSDFMAEDGYTYVDQGSKSTRN